MGVRILQRNRRGGTTSGGLGLRTWRLLGIVGLSLPLVVLAGTHEASAATKQAGPRSTETHPVGRVHSNSGPGAVVSIGNGPGQINNYVETQFPANDDGTWPCGGNGNAPVPCPGPNGQTGPATTPLGFTINFFGTPYSSAYVNNNGNITFGQPLSTFTPTDLTSFNNPIIAPFFADVDTRIGNVVNFGTGTLNGHQVFVVNWPGVGCYDQNDTVQNDFQLILIDRPDVQSSPLGDSFDMEFNYGNIQWDTGQASGGDANCINGPTGNTAFVGFSNGTANPGDSFNLRGSGVPNAFLNSNPATGLINNDLNSSVLGRYIFEVNSGVFSFAGYDLVGSDGGVYVFGGASGSGFYGSLPGLGVHVNNITGIVPTANDQGYFLVGSDGGVFAFNAPFEDSLPGLGVHVNNIRGIVPSPDDRGYLLVGSDGGVFTFGDAPYFGSLPSDGISVNNIVALAETPDGGGYWLVASNGAVYSFGDANYFGSLPGQNVVANDIVGIVPSTDGQGYLLIGADGGTFAFGDAQYLGSLPSLGVHVSNIVGATPTL